MKLYQFIVLLATAILISCTAKEKKILVFSKTKGFRHESIKAGQDFFFKIGQEKEIKVDTTENAEMFIEENLKEYSAIIFLNTTGDVLNHAQQADFERYIQAGGGYLGIHAASDTEYSWPWYGKLMGGWFDGHPSDPNVRVGKVTVIDKDHLSTKNLPSTWDKQDEFYNFKSLNSDVNFLITVDEKSYKAGKHGAFHPLSWYHEYDGGKAFYTNFGHTPETFSEKEFFKHIEGGLDYVIGKNKRNYNLVKTERLPIENRFVKKIFLTDLDEPMELEVLPNGKILFVERKGDIKLYDPKNDEVKLLTQMEVHTKFEDGLLGLSLDPGFEKNYRLYLFYSPVGDKAIQRVSRFTLLADSLMMDSEKIVIEIPVQREQCCHSAGSMEFGPDGNLFIALGDDTSPFNTNQTFDTNGFGPMDEREGRAPYDAQKSSGNTNDLRGKILRIKPEEDGSYSIPDGNLFPKDGSIGRPEIFVMGCRNPYRIAIDQKTGWLYWGDVGPDAGNDNEQRGPRGYDEFNQAKVAGNYGWPYFVGNNFPYRKMDYKTGEVGDFFDPARPINTSPNNTGATVLPPAKPPLIWYPYAKTKEFADMGEGGRNAMAGPPYYYDDYYGAKNRFPTYYDGKVFHYDWSRNWIHAVTLDENGNYLYHEPFLPNFKFEKIIDMQFAQDGTMYILEYGSNWFAKNPDAVLAQIDYASENRHPHARIDADLLVGAHPLEVNFSAEKSFDYDKSDELTFEWFFTEDEIQNEGKNVSFTFEKPGVYHPKVKVTDTKGASSIAEMEIKVGNQKPEVKIQLAGNSSFYWGNSSIDYQVQVNDKEDGNIVEGVNVSFDYIATGHDLTVVAQGHTQTGALLNAEILIEEKGCKTCHSFKEASVGPSYQQVAEKYNSSDATVKKLAQKVIKGGGGVWGERMMAANPSLLPEEAEEMVKFILAMDEQSVVPSLPLSGAINTDKHKIDSNEGSYILTASYTDRGGEVIGPLTSVQKINLKSPRIQAEDYDEMHNLNKRKPGGSDYMHLDKIVKDSYFSFKNIDMTGIEELTIRTGQVGSDGYIVNIRSGSVDGEIIASQKLPFTNGKRVGWSETTLSINKMLNGKRDLFFTFDFEGEDDKAFVTFDWIYFHQPKSVSLAVR
ncbi:MAG: ThuA domain-containing protein [Bacteroidota bacterium]